MAESQNRIGVEVRPAAYLAAAAALNVPFLLCHPGWPAVELELVRSLTVAAVLFLVPGLPWVAAAVGRGRLTILAAMAGSTVVLLGVLALFRLTGQPLTAAGAWNATWAVTNAGILLNFFLGGPPTFGLRLRDNACRLGLPLFLAAYVLFFWGATRVVPPRHDHDLEIIPSGHALLTRFEPLFVGDYGNNYQFAHPPLFHYWVAGSFLYFNRLDYLKFYDQAAQRAHGTMTGNPPDTFPQTADDLDKATGTHRVVGVDGSNYVIDPPRSDGGTVLPALEFERDLIWAYMRRQPCFAESRTPTVFLGALTVAMLGCWIASATHRRWPAWLLPAAYATSPEIFVRSSYAGYTAVSNFAVLAVLMAVERYHADHDGDSDRRRLGIECFLAGTAAALINHKLVLLPAAVVVWQVMTTHRGGSPERPRLGERLIAALLHPVAIGFLCGTAVFWAWGLSIDPAAFWRDHVAMHLLDRIAHHNPMGYVGYPGVVGLWCEFWRHTGYLLLPTGIVCLALGCFAANDEDSRFRDTFRLWAVWSLIVAVAFSVVDWRQTKHLMPLMLVLHLAPARCTTPLRGLRPNPAAIFAVTFLVLLAWNLWSVQGLVRDFASFQVTPDW